MFFYVILEYLLCKIVSLILILMSDVFLIKELKKQTIKKSFSSTASDISKKKFIKRKKNDKFDNF